ncbi:hypothetical protein [Paraburkholderia sp. Ac-20347]|uniref:hypothetical protein n=1 Tax=Paraburkholderia sp. Ac-20347 TaxID=2703892 RepID=UPI00197FD484|nr:hypothetical protein [Paraburkholderia sp. Ac-20347]MBN3812641.1 hypothetical protein [Paraburkholderia sp. Ac-20347]
MARAFGQTARNGVRGSPCTDARSIGMTKSMGKKNRGRMAPEQQRQEENGDAAASPHTYRKDRQHLSMRVRNFFNFPDGLRRAMG